MAQQLIALTALAEDLNLVPSIHIVTCNHPLTPVLEDLVPFSEFHEH